MVAILRTTFSIPYSYMTTIVLLSKISLNLVVKGALWYGILTWLDFDDNIWSIQVPGVPHSLSLVEIFFLYFIL